MNSQSRSVRVSCGGWRGWYISDTRTAGYYMHKDLTWHNKCGIDNFYKTEEEAWAAVVAWRHSNLLVENKI